MKRLFIFVLLAVGSMYLHARVTFSESRVNYWLVNHSVRFMQGDQSACDDYDSDVEVTLTAEGRRGRWEVEGGKDEICGYMKQASAAFIVLQASTESVLSNVKIEAGGFPWTKARVSFKETTTVRVKGMPSMTIESNDTVLLARTFTGVKIKSLESKSEGWW